MVHVDRTERNVTAFESLLFSILILLLVSQARLSTVSGGVDIALFLVVPLPSKLYGKLKNIGRY